VRYLCIDLGDQRTGLAVGDETTRIVSPVGVLEVPRSQLSGKALLAAIARAISDHAPAALVVGLPINMDDTEGPRAKLVRTFARELEQATSLPVHFQDERLSTAEADWRMARSGLTHGQKKARRDAIAAAAILTEFLNRVHPETPTRTDDDPTA
jgi:putative holliday junction resolvase